MTCTINQAQRRYILHMFVAALFCIVFSLVASLTFRFRHPGGIVAWLTAVLPALPIVGALAATGLYLNDETDDFERTLFVQAILIGTGGTLALTTAWGYLETYTHAQHLDLVWIYPIFWCITGLAVPVVKLRYR
jgi:hypothetical protein